MPRYKKMRYVSSSPEVEEFSPAGGDTSEEVVLSLEGFEAIKLSDYKGLDQSEASEIMGVSRQTYGRILREARSVVAKALVTGRKIKIAGGCYSFRNRGQRGRRRRHRGGFNCNT